MSLDVWLTVDDVVYGAERGVIFIREDGQTKEISREEWLRRFPDREPVSVRIGETNEVYSANITHNLGKMAVAAGIYDFVWRPDENGITKASQLIEPLRDGLSRLKSNPIYYKQFDSENGWGSYKNFLPWIERYLNACQCNTDANIHVSR